MERMYFEMDDDVCAEGRWYLNGLSDKKGNQLDSRDLRYGIPVDTGPPLKISLCDEDTVIEVDPPLKVSLRRPGKPLEFTFADFDMPVVTAKVADLISDIAGPDIQRIPVQVSSRRENYEIINVISRFDCIDAERSEIEWWTDEDDRPDKLGKPRMIAKLVIDGDRVPESHIFRPQGWEVALVVSDVLKRTFDDQKITGVRFRRA